MAEFLPRVTQQDYHSGEFPTLRQPWWSSLPEDFYRYPDRFALPGHLRQMVNATVALDQVTRTGLAAMVTLASAPSMLTGRQLAEDIERREFYQQFLEQGEPDAFFRPPDPVNAFREQPASSYHYSPPDGENVLVSFPSGFEPVHPDMRARYLSARRNRIAWAQHWRHGDRPRPTLVVIHGFVADPYWLNARFLALPWFFRQGYDVLLYTMPFHGRRRSPLAPFSGAEFFAGGVSHVNEAFAHTIHDLRVFLRYLRERGVEQIGATGISLGGYTTALLAALEKQLAFAIPNVPVVSPFDLVMDWFPLNVPMRAMMARTGTTLTDLRHASAVHAALSWPCQLPREKRMIIGGVGDRFAPPKQSWLLWQHWNECQIHWFPGNHLLHLDQGRYLREMKAFIQRSGFSLVNR